MEGGQAAAAYISQCTQRTGHLIYIEPRGSSCSVVLAVVDVSILNNINAVGADVLEGRMCQG